jgi:hypothetical protein
VQVACNTLLESSQQELQLCFRPHPDWRSKRGIIVSQSGESPNLANFETPLWQSWDKKPFGCMPRGEAQKILYGWRWWLTPVGAVVSLMSLRSPAARPRTKGVPTVY